MNTYKLPIPAQLNGDQLQAEIGALSVRVNGNDLIIDSDKTEAEVLSLVAAHIPAPFVEPTVADKLAAAGLTLDELKTALGL